MKRCPQCRRDYYDDSLLYCLDDGSALLEGPASGGGRDEPATAIIEPKESLRSPGSADATTKMLPRERSGKKILVLIVVALAAAAGYVLYRYVTNRPAVSERKTITPETQRLTGDGQVREAAISPDGKFLAYLRDDRGERSIWLKQVQTNTTIQVVKPGELSDFGSFAFSPDGNFLHFNARTPNEPDTIYRVSSIGGSPTKMLTAAFAIQFSPDGRQISYGRYDPAANQGGIYIANVDGSNERKLVARGGTKFIEARPAWSPDGKWIAIVDGDDALLPNPNQALTLVSVENGSEIILGEKWVVLDDLVWHPSGDSLIVCGSDNPQAVEQLWEVSYPDGARRRITNNLNGHVSVTITADGKSIVTGELFARSAIWVSPDLRPENAKQVMPASADTWGLSWTPDNRIVFASDQSGFSEIWIMDADGGNARQLTNDRAFKTVPVVSSDGRHIVYWASSGLGQLVRIDINGGNPFAYANTVAADNPDFSPDNRWVIYSAWSGGSSNIFRVPIDGGEPQQLTSGVRASEPRYSHDGSRFACIVADKTTGIFDQLAIYPAEGGEAIKTFKLPRNTNVGRGPIWTPDDKGITLIVAQGVQNLWVQPVDGGEAKPLTNFQLPGVARREYSRDGKRIAVVRGEGFGNAIMITGFR